MREKRNESHDNSFDNTISMDESHNIDEFEVLWKNKLCAKVRVDYKSQKVDCKQFTDDFLARPFNKKDEDVTIDDVLDFFEFRCFPRERANRDQLLKDLGLDSYFPREIVRKTHGIILEDFMWIRFKGETITYDDIKVRDD